MNPSDLSAVRGRHGIWHGSVEYEPSGHMDGGYLWGEPGLTWCGAHLVDPEYDNHEITCKKCLRWVDPNEVSDSGD